MNQRIFLAHGKGDEDVALKMKLSIKLDGQPYDIVTGKEDFDERFKTCGSWDSWASSVAQGRYMGRPRFDAFVVPWGAAHHHSIGRATMQIVTGALLTRKPIYAWNTDTGVFLRVVSVEAVDPEDWKAGWVLGTAPLGVIH